MLIIPAIYIEKGQAVSLYKGHGNEQKIVYNRSLINIARDFAKSKPALMQIIDLDASRAGQPVNLKTIERIVSETGVPIEVGGGIRTIDDIDALMHLRVSRVILGVSARPLIPQALAKYGPDRIVFGIKAKQNMIVDSDIPTEHSNEVIEIGQRVAEMGIKHIVYKDLERQGALYHPNYDDLDRLIEGIPGVYIYSSGGVTSMEDFGLLTRINAAGVIVSRAFIEYKLNLAEAIRRYQVS